MKSPRLIHTCRVRTTCGPHSLPMRWSLAPRRGRAPHPLTSSQGAAHPAVVSASGRAADAAALSGMAASVWRRLGTSLHAFGPHATTEGNRHSSLIDDQLGTSCAAAIRAEYGQVSVQEAVRLGIEIGVDGAGDDETARPRPGSRSPRTSSPLTDRERQIAALIADGMSNRDIAAELTISVRTVDGHVERILRKLDFGSRTQVASWMAAAARVRS